jgi:hypothetical protein
MAPHTEKAFWVAWRGAVARRDGDPVNPSDDALKAYLSFLTATFAARDDLGHPAIASANTHLWMTSSVQAASPGAAVDKVKQAFDECLGAIGNGKLPACEDASWSAYTLEGEPIQVRELSPV